MLYLSQRKISQITRMIDKELDAQESIGDQRDRSQKDPENSKTYQTQNQQHQHQSSNQVGININPANTKLLDQDISKTDKDIKSYQNKFFYQLMTAAFLGFCSIAIGIGANMKYGVGEMSAFESLAGKHGAHGTAENLWNSGSTTDPLRGINYGFAVAGFTFPILGTLLSLCMALYSKNQINKGQKINDLRGIAKAGFSMSKSAEPEYRKPTIQEKINEISLSPPCSISAREAVALAKAHQKELKAQGL